MAHGDPPNYFEFFSPQQWAATPPTISWSVPGDPLKWEPEATPVCCDECGWTPEDEDSDHKAHFNSGIETAASHLERAGLKLMAREIRDLRKS